MPVIPATPFDQFMADADTGDIVVFAGDSLVSQAVEWLTWGKFSHSAMVVVLDDGTKCLWQAISEELYVDPLTGAAHTGAQLGPLADTMTYIDSVGDVPTWCQLQLRRTPAFRAAVAAAVEELEGRPFPDPTTFVVSYCQGLLGYDDTAGPLFCSALVALTYQRAGLLPQRPVANSFCPTDLSSERDVLHRLLLAGSMVPDQLLDMSAAPPPPPLPGQ